MDSDEDIPTKRESHFNQQRSSHRSSLRSEKSANQPQRSRSRASSGHHLIEDFNLDLDRRLRIDQADAETLPSPSSDASPAPNIPFSRSRGNSSARKKSGSRAQSAKRRSGPEEAKRLEEILALPSPSIHLEALRDPGLREPRGGNSKTSSRGQASHTSSWPLGRGNPSNSQIDITALPNISKGSKKAKRESNGDSYMHARSNHSPQSSSRLTTEIYTISYLIFFAIWGTLARVGLQALTFYPGAPVIFSELWANVAGTFIMGFLSEDRRLFRAEWGNRGDRLPEPFDQPAGSHEEQQREKARHGKVKKTIPMYIGLATGFCGSFTSFSSFIRDVFLALANELPSPVNHRLPIGVPLPSRADTMPRNAGYSVMALLGTIILTIATCYAALHVGAHLALALDRITPSLPFRFTRRFIDPLFVFLGWGTWFGALMMAIFPPRNAWRGQAIFACVFAPLGCLARYYISLALNPIRPSSPLGTFTVNIFGTAVLGMAYDLQRVPLLAAGVVGGSVAGCQVLQGVMDGFCGCLTTVSTWIVEIDALKRRSAYVYAAASVGVGLGLMVIIMGSVRWTVGWEEVLCVS